MHFYEQFFSPPLFFVMLCLQDIFHSYHIGLQSQEFHSAFDRRTTSEDHPNTSTIFRSEESTPSSAVTFPRYSIICFVKVLMLVEYQRSYPSNCLESLAYSPNSPATFCSTDEQRSIKRRQFVEDPKDTWVF